MRIRQVRPEFFTDPTTSRLSVDVRLTYIGLWCVADDAGWLEFNAEHIAAMLYPYESIRVRTHRLEKSKAELEAAGRLVLHDCGCAQIPTLEHHQKIGGTKSFTARDKHRSIHLRTNPPVVRLGNGSYNARERDEEEARKEAWRRQGLPVDVA